MRLIKEGRSGRTIYIVRWKLNFPGIRLKCFKCPNGEMIHTDFDYKSHGFATLLLKISGHDDYACSMQYSCNCSDAKCKGIDGRLLTQLETHQRNAYPVDPRYAVSKETHMHLSLSRVVDSMMVTHGNGEQLCQMLSSLRGEAHLDREEEYYSQVIATVKTVERQFPSYEESIGKYGPSPKVLQNWKDEAMSSNLTCTGVSDKDRAQREIQGVGADTSISSDGTYAVLKNYRSDEIEGAKEAHCIVTNDSEMASTVLAPDSKQVHVLRIKLSNSHFDQMSCHLFISRISVLMESSFGNHSSTKYKVSLGGFILFRESPRLSTKNTSRLQMQLHSSVNVYIGTIKPV